jgi:hypothetical protein
MAEPTGAVLQERPKLTTDDRILLDRGMRYYRGDVAPGPLKLREGRLAFADALEKALDLLHPRCRVCGAKYSAMEADAGMTTCERCPEDVSTPEVVAQRVAHAMNEDPLFIALVVVDQVDWVHLETEPGEEYILEVQPALTAGTAQAEGGNPDPVTAGELYDLLLLWGYEVPLETLQAWSPEVIEEAARYVAATIAHANDHDVPAEDWPKPPAELESALKRYLPHPSLRSAEQEEG